MVDWDNILSYATVKIVRIKEKRLGLIHYGLLLVILIYIVIVTILIQKRYLLTEQPIGTVRTSLLAPENRTPPANRTAATLLPYCIQNSSTYEYNNIIYPNYECYYWDEEFVLYPDVEESDVFVTTRVTITNEQLPDNCSFTEPTCVYNDTSSEIIYIDDPESFTILFDHTFYASTLGIQKNAAQIPGSFLNFNGATVNNLTSPNTVGQKQSDILEVGTILQAAGVNLDTTSETNSNITKRYDGIVMFLFITYTNTDTLNQGNYHYTIQPSVIHDTKFKITQPIYALNIANRVTWDRHGIRLVIIQSGQIGRFDFQVLLLAFVAGLGLLAVATVISDAIALYLLPQKETYNEFKYEDVDLHPKSTGKWNSIY